MLLYRYYRFLSFYRVYFYFYFFFPLDLLLVESLYRGRTGSFIYGRSIICHSIFFLPVYLYTMFEFGTGFRWWDLFRGGELFAAVWEV